MKVYIGYETEWIFDQLGYDPPEQEKVKVVFMTYEKIQEWMHDKSRLSNSYRRYDIFEIEDFEESLVKYLDGKSQH